MVPLRFRKEGQFYHLGKEEFKSSILELCNKHRDENRALCFCFLFHDYSNPQIFKILADDHYWNALHEISGHFLSIFYIATDEEVFGQDLRELDGKEQRGLYGLKTEQDFANVIKPILKQNFEIDDPIHLPSLIFFQADGKGVIDYFAVELNEQRIEESFLELRDYISNSVDTLKGVQQINYGNSQAIFNLLKDTVTGRNLKRRLFKATKSFPMNLLLGWVTSKV
tara:strand:+ start:512 stop:1186 length:675 start_codon:yes stop_codon:yes gene_type:complete